MAIDAHRMAMSLATRLKVVVPSSVDVRNEGSSIILAIAGKDWSRIEIGLLLAPPEPDVENALWVALSSAQDFVAEELAEPWPQPPRGGLDLPLPTIKRIDGGYRLLYGDVETPSLELSPLYDHEFDG